MRTKLAKKHRLFRKTQDGKWLLRDPKDRYIPMEVSERENPGCSAPYGDWLKGESIEYVKYNLLSANAKFFKVLNKNII